MSSTVDRDVACPRCKYNLRGLTSERCPECGLDIDADELAVGIPRENIETWLDRCDPWQPHQVLVRSLFELLCGALRPWRRLHTLDINGPTAPAVLMLAFGTLWVWLVAALLTAAATFVYTGASPAASLRCGVLLWAPRLLAAAALPVLTGALVLRIPQVARIAAATTRQRFRLAAYWMPAVAAWCCWPLALGLLLSPVFTTGMLWAGPLAAGLLALYVSARATSQAQTLRPPQRLLLVSNAAAVFGSLAGAYLSHSILPTTLEPPYWIYFP